MVEKNKKLQKKLEEILPESIKDEGNFNVYDCKNLLLQFYNNKSIKIPQFTYISQLSKQIPVSFESSRGLINGGSSLDLMMELEKLKSYLNNVELQLYEANEHISDLLEKVRLTWKFHMIYSYIVWRSSIKTDNHLIRQSFGDLKINLKAWKKFHKMFTSIKS